MLEDYFADTATVSRGTVTGNKTTFAEVGSFACHIQPISDTYGSDPLQRPGKSFRMFSTSEVLIGDRLEDQNGTKYEVSGVKSHTFRSRSHYEATLRGV